MRGMGEICEGEGGKSVRGRGKSVRGMGEICEGDGGNL